MNITIEIDVQVNNGDFDLWLSDNCGGSGISVCGNSAKEVVDNLKPYIEYYMLRAQYGTPCEWDELKSKISFWLGNKVIFGKKGITLDACFEDENIVVFSVDSELYAETNKGKQYLPSIIKDEYDFYKIEDFIDDLCCD
jgi:hypothetical protein